MNDDMKLKENPNLERQETILTPSSDDACFMIHQNDVTNVTYYDDINTVLETLQNVIDRVDRLEQDE